MAFSLQALKEWLAGQDDSEVDSTDVSAADDPTETPEAVGEGEDPTAEAAGDAPADAAPEVEADPVLPESDESVEELRDSLNRLASENESLRNRIAELGGDAALGILETDPEPDPDESGEGDGDESDDYDDDAAQADIDKQLAEIAALKNS